MRKALEKNCLKNGMKLSGIGIDEMFRNWKTPELSTLRGSQGRMTRCLSCWVLRRCLKSLYIFVGNPSPSFLCEKGSPHPGTTGWTPYF